MNRKEKKSHADEKRSGFSEKEFMEYLEERFRKLKLEEQKFREEALEGGSNLNRNSDYIKLNG